MAFDLEGKRVLVTGGSSGIGAALAEDFAAAGAVVGICARRADRLAEVHGRLTAVSPGSRMWVADLSIDEEVDRVAATAVDELGGVDVLVNNAGIPKRRHVTRLDPETVEAVMRINYLSPVRLTLALLPQMLERGEGRFINISSVAAPLSAPGEAAYGATKAALTVFSETMAVDLWDTGIKVMLVYPGVIDTELFHLPDNDPFHGDVDALPVSEAVAAVRAGLDQDALQVFVPSWFADVAKGKANDLEGFLRGTAEYVRTRGRGDVTDVNGSVSELLALLEHGPGTQREHALQTAELLATERPDDLELQVAGLLHDVGHLLAPGDDAGHGDVAARAVAPVLGPRVADLVRLHVAAKRYLVTVDPSYRDVLAADSTATLAGQGDVLSHPELEAFEAEPHAADALALRRADDAGKVLGHDAGDVEHWHGALLAVAEAAHR